MIVPLPQSGQGCPTRESALTVAAGVAFGFFSFGAPGFRSRFFGSFFTFSPAWAAAAS